MFRRLLILWTATTTISGCRSAICPTKTALTESPPTSVTFRSDPLRSGAVTAWLKALDIGDDRLEDLMHLDTLGKSARGEEIYLVRLGRDDTLPCLYVLCRQHGNETAPTEAALQLIREFIKNTERRALLQQARICLALVMNPDGANAFRRDNAAKADLNQDWRDYPNRKRLPSPVLSRNANPT